jgi:hypothetical protein
MCFFNSAGRKGAYLLLEKPKLTEVVLLKKLLHSQRESMCYILELLTYMVFF